MTIQEILEAHKPVTHGHVLCECRIEFKTDQNHRAHVAEVLEQHVREREARAWSTGFHKGRKTEINAHISTWPKNPYRMETL